MASLGTIAVVAAAGSWLGARLDPMARAGGRIFGPPAIPDFLGRDQDGNAIAAPDVGGHVLIGDFIDTPAVLEAYAQRWKGDRARWKLVTLEPGGLDAMLAAIESAAPQEAGNQDEPHTTRFFLADTRGLIVATYAGENRLAIRQLTAGAAALQR